MSSSNSIEYISTLYNSASEMLIAVSLVTATAVPPSLAQPWTMQSLDVVAATNGPTCIGVLQLWYSRL